MSSTFTSQALIALLDALKDLAREIELLVKQERERREGDQ